MLMRNPLLAYFSQIQVILHSGYVISAQLIDYHLNNFKPIGIFIEIIQEIVYAKFATLLHFN